MSVMSVMRVMPCSLGSWVAFRRESWFLVGRERYVARTKVVDSRRCGSLGLDHREGTIRAVGEVSLLQAISRELSRVSCWAFYPPSPRRSPLIFGHRFRDRWSPRVRSRRSSFRARVLVSQPRMFRARPTRLTSPRSLRPGSQDMPTRPSAPHPSGAFIIQRVCGRDPSSWRCEVKRRCVDSKMDDSGRPGLDARTNKKRPDGSESDAGTKAHYFAWLRESGPSPRLRSDRHDHRNRTQSPGFDSPR